MNANTTQRQPRVSLGMLADRLGCDAAMLRAIARGEVHCDGLVGSHPDGGSFMLGTLAEYDEMVREADRVAAENWRNRR